ncbi:haloacid dehalogenase type II [Sideroxydans lithotrophicus]|uniref:(S)-2-haloacid dehalogenase n=1 Tax=Sideroxydans lithotrophicus (strain ES-1) TaxID=580332 RepID=D5CRI7_SIDLE|nr:haloacid dehalogenase type II [Sideroxydans lithotrophicus]ADE11573.1 haloacid dehalogenase, type II [Sideroxydans lithotrophicus ES-1]
MAITLAFDVYGTLIDTHGVISALERYAGKDAAAFSRTWREKQLEYSFRRGLMQNYENFAVCTSNALDYTSSYYQVPLSAKDKEALMGVYRSLPAFSDVQAGLSLAGQAGFRMFAFSNGSLDAVEALLRNAGLRDYFLGVVSVDEMKSFKPNPAVYSHFLRRTGAVGADAWLVSSNPFDVIGAISAGMRAAWVKRTTDAIFDPWGIEPTITVNSLANLAERIEQEGKSE